MNGLVLIDKPRGWTSHDVVNRWRRLAQTRRAGHLGTLDPMATGLLLLVSGTATRLARFFEGTEKTYEAGIQLGLVSDTYDADGEVKPTGAPVPAKESVMAKLDGFRGTFLQTPPPISAKKIKGVPAYKLARRHQPVQLSAAEVTVGSLVLREFSAGRLELTITCSSGTYIRSIAHDLGTALGCGAILAELRRTRCAGFSIEDARTLQQLEALAEQGSLAEAVIGATRLLPEFPSAYVDCGTEAQIRQGRDFRTSPFSIKPGTPFVKAVSESGELISIGELKLPNLYHPMLVL